MRIYIAGSNGQLAHDVMAVLARRGTLAGGDLPGLDIVDPESVRSELAGYCPEIVVNCAAYTKVDACETDRETARRVNVEGPRNLAETTRAMGALLIHISTDYVFDGRRVPPAAYRETDTPNPVSCYGATKLAGEQAIQSAGGRYAILRTAWLYGVHGQNFPKTMLRKALADPARVLRVVNDQYGSPTWSWRLAHQIDAIIARGGQGVYHATAEGYCTWYEFAEYFLRCMAVPHRVDPCATADYPTPARRPGNSILANARLKDEGVNCMMDWREDVTEFVRRHRDRLLEELSP